MPDIRRSMVFAAVAACLSITCAATSALGRVPGTPSSIDAVPRPAGAHEHCDSIRTAGHAFVRGVNCRSIEIDGFDREYIVYVPRDPSFDLDRPAPLVFMFHGTGGTGDQFLRISGWRELSDQHGIISVYPQGLKYRILDSGRKKTKWNSFGLADQVDLDEKPAGYPDTSPWPADDVGFVKRILGDVDGRLAIDPPRRFIAGFSNGAEFAARLAVQRSRTFAAAAYFAGGLEEARNPKRNMPVFTGAGTLDDRVLARVNAQDPPPDPLISELPLDPDAFLSIPTIADFLSTQLGTFELKLSPHTAMAQPHRTLMTWATPKSTNHDGNEFVYLLLGDVKHQYPNEHNNPQGFRFAKLSWGFFVAHPGP